MEVASELQVRFQTLTIFLIELIDKSLTGNYSKTKFAETHSPGDISTCSD